MLRYKHLGYNFGLQNASFTQLEYEFPPWNPLIIESSLESLNGFQIKTRHLNHLYTPLPFDGIFTILYLRYSGMPKELSQWWFPFCCSAILYRSPACSATHSLCLAWYSMVRWRSEESNLFSWNVEISRHSLFLYCWNYRGMKQSIHTWAYIVVCTCCLSEKTWMRVCIH